MIIVSSWDGKGGTYQSPLPRSVFKPENEGVGVGGRDHDETTLPPGSVNPDVGRTGGSERDGMASSPKVGKYLETNLPYEPVSALCGSQLTSEFNVQLVLPFIPKTFSRL